MKNIRDMSPDEILELPQYGLDDTMMLGCKGCGKCCHNRDDLILTPYDTFSIAKFLVRDTVEIIERYCEMYIGRDSQLPIARVAPNPPTDFCPFLRGKKCSIHAAKPIKCVTYPLARFVVLGEERHEFVHPMNCSRSPELKEYRVRDWVGHAASDEAYTAALMFTKATAHLTMALKGDKGLSAIKHGDKLKLYSIIAGAFYRNYDIKGDFIAQFDANMVVACEKLSGYIPIESWDVGQ